MTMTPDALAIQLYAIHPDRRVAVIRAVAPFVGWHLHPSLAFDAGDLQDALIRSNLQHAQRLPRPCATRWDMPASEASRLAQVHLVEAACRCITTPARNPRHDVVMLEQAVRECFGRFIFPAVHYWFCCAFSPGTPAVSLEVCRLMRDAVAQLLEDEGLSAGASTARGIGEWAWCPEQTREWYERVRRECE